ncbi:peptide chain release factor N(5)-glutamine methyltransferase [Candidatus Hepatincolaceae symbiont of Richtersius coronifer]
MLLKTAFNQALQLVRLHFSQADLMPFGLSNSCVLKYQQEIRLILQNILEINNINFILLQNFLQLQPKQIITLHQYIKRRLKGEPLAYILKYQYFWEDKFYVNSKVLIPRNDTEIMIQAVLDNYRDKAFPGKILDIGIGSGCILLSLLKEYQHTQGVGVDISLGALAVAARNALNLDISYSIFYHKNFKPHVKISKKGNYLLDEPEKIKEEQKYLEKDYPRCLLVHDSLFSGFTNYSWLTLNKFDLIISNPPYIDLNDQALEAEVKRYEPALALFADNRGLYFYKEILSKAYDFLKPNGLIILEIGYKQYEEVIELSKKNNFKLKKVYKDLRGIKRVVCFEPTNKQNMLDF